MNTAPIGPAEYENGDRKGEARTLTVALASCRPEDYPSLSTTKVKVKGKEVTVPSVDIPTASVTIPNATSTAEILAAYPTPEAGEAALVSAWNASAFSAGRSELKRRWAAIKAFSGDVSAVMAGFSDAVLRNLTNPATRMSKAEAAKVVTAQVASINLDTASDEDIRATLAKLQAALGLR